ncbi:acyl-[acyl-carrier-protein]-phospholipid O-acyltransferase / long-chain-fatty-acid--[acyl-carrier-protein] ligase [Rubritalea squalenifaciens DSM 18772]|uniref:Acyl-[acyl-carrier-protein]-phospholipid O-acyltransferase / long-chain-fatty-acid--[acyl-carrier-protein] ligase n=1 Tax=Rubritalea squalenifaciens DSM 18772 TaxID=1123071 RepID=A0A1M6NN18_9BACT|nr:AMP-binding protein [Rubritalea squalenifaciens]SHJ97034.1 acyl-[acyl-carrier-protein]-phospholipid O-acyltransferase / long-chain-fatty-acid--[acyl-carrier-protein] ligase [Rubritalea squalenifaciens DSM 18772]
MSKSIQVIGKENLPNRNVLIVPGRLNYPELVQLEKLLSGRKIIWLCEESAVIEDSIQAHLSKPGTEAVAFSSKDKDLQQVGKQLFKDLGDNGVAVFLPGEALALPGTASLIPSDTLKAITELGLPSLPLAVQIPADSSLSIESTSSLPSVIFSFGKLLHPSDMSPAAWLEGLLTASEAAFSSREFLKGSLGMALLAGLKKHSSCTVFDGSKDDSKSFAIILGVAIAFSKHISQQTKKKRVGIILPPGLGGMIANLAVIFAGKVPVNLNFTASHEAVHSAIKQADLDKFITADPFIRKMPSFPWPPNRDLIYLERVLPQLKKSITRWVLLSKVTPTKLLAKLVGIDPQGGDKEAILLFTSGSSGAPKGVPLTHRNLLANVCQFGTRLNLPHNATILGSLPLFHSFGCTVTLWFPIIEGLNLVTYPSPLETKRIAELIEEHKIVLLLATPTFLRGYMRRVTPEQLKPLKLVVTGAEKLPTSLANAFHQKFNIMPQEGYGLTETSPATNVNLPAPEPAGNLPVIPAAKVGTVGNFLPGIAVKLTDPSTDKPVPIDQPGIIWMKGANVFPGYLNNEEKTKEVIIDGWFKTGDVGRMDDQGFLSIEGRISRFSKIAGEMVPHETVEAAVNNALGLDEETERKIAIVGIPDAQKGEAIALLSTISGVALEQECIDLRYRLLENGLPSLWCPKRIIPVEEIPILASGKLDIKACQQLSEKVDQ